MRAYLSAVTILLSALACLIWGDLALAQTTAPELPLEIELAASEVDGTLRSEFSIHAATALGSLTLTPSTLSSQESTARAAVVALTPDQIPGLGAGQTQVVTMTVDVPTPGLYTGVITVTWGEGVGESKATIPVTLEVHRAIKELPDAVHLTLQAKADGTGQEYRGVLRITSAANAAVNGLRLTNVTCLAHQDDPGGCGILETSITRTPADAVTLQPGESQSFDIRLAGLPANTGRYTGTFEITYENRSGPRQDHAVHLLLKADPAYVRADKRNLNLQPEASGGSFKDSFVLDLDRGPAGEFTEVGKVEFSVGSLQRVDAGATPGSTPIAADLITVTPASGTLTLNREVPVRTVTVEVTPPTGAQFPAGTYQGTLAMYYFSTGAQYQPENSLTFTLTLDISAPVLARQARGPLILHQQAPGGAYQATFYVQVESGEMRNIVFNTSTLELKTGPDDGDIRRIEADELDIEPEPTGLVISPETGSRAFTIRVTPATGSNFYEGTYTGTLGVSYAGGIAENLDLALVAKPDATLQWTRDAGAGATISIKGTTGPGLSVESYPATFAETGEKSAARLTSIAAEDLVDQADVSDTLPNGVLKPLESESGANMTIPAGGSETYTLTFDFAGKRLSPGVYNGFVRVKGENVDTQRLPLQISLRHPFLPCPLLAFGLGTALAVGLQLYASRYRRRDQALSEVEYWESALRKKEETDSPFYQFYGSFVRDRLEDARALLQSPEWGKEENLTQAEAFIKGVRTLQHRWLGHANAFHREKGRLDYLVRQLALYGPSIQQYRYLGARKKALDSILAGLDGYDTGQALESAVAAEVDRFEAFARAFKAQESANGLLNSLSALPEDDTFTLAEAGLPAPLKRAFQARWDAESRLLRETEADTEIKSMETRFLAIGRELGETDSLYQGVASAMVLLSMRLKLPDIQGELEGDEQRDYDDRYAAQKKKLAAAGDQASLTAVSQATATITAALQERYNENRLFYFRACPDIQEADAWIKEIDALCVANGGPYLGWNEVTAMMAAYKQAADRLVNSTRDNYRLASNYMFWRWRILWFYRHVMPWVYEKLGGQLQPGEVRNKVKDVVVWLLNNTHHTLTPEEFDREFYDNHVEQAYVAVNGTLLEPLKGPFVPPRPEPPGYRPLATPILSEAAGHPGGWSAMESFSQGEPSLLEFPAQGARGSEPSGERRTFGARLRSRWQRLKGFVADPDFRLGLFGVGVWLMAFVVLLYFGWRTWNNNPTFGASWEDYFGIILLSFAGLSTTDLVVKSALTTLQGWGAVLPKSS